MKNDCRTITVGELVASGVLERPMDGNHGELHPKSSDFVSTGIPFVMASNLRGGAVDTTTCQFITVERADTLRKGFAKSGDVLLSHKGTIGRTAIVQALDLPFVVLTPQVTYYRVIDEGRLHNRYLKYYFDSAAFQDLFQSWANAGSTRAYLGITAQLKLPVRLPDIGEQQAIATVLGALDDKIELNRQMNRTLEATTQALFKSWFVDFDPVVAKAAGRQPFAMDAQIAALFPNRFTESSIGPLPAGWVAGSVSQIARYVNGRNFTKGASGQGRMVIRIAELNSGPGPSTVYSGVDAPAEHVAYPDDLLFAWSGSLGLYRWHRNPGLINQHIFKVICNVCPKWFVYFHLKEALPFFQGIAADKATTMGHIKRSHLEEVRIPIPPPVTVKTATSIAEPLFDAIHSNERESLVLAALRDTLLPKLLSGEIRVRQAEKVVQEAV